MSGGSYNYLYQQAGYEILSCSHDDELQRMADRLAELGYADAAKETLEVLLEARIARNRIDTRIKRLQGVWHAVEWKDSYDGDHVAEAIAEYRGETDATDGG